MKLCYLTMQRAIGLSMAAHVLLFGSALAVARYGGYWSGTDARTIFVSLVPDGGPGTVRYGRMRPVPVEREGAAPAPAVETVVPQASGQTETSVAEGNETEATEGQAVEGAVGDEQGPAAVPAAGAPLFGYSAQEWSRLQAAIEKVKTYPRFARERGIEGTVVVRFKVLPNGNIGRVDVVKSSGARILDDATVRTVYDAAPVPFVEGWVEVPMAYRLRTNDGTGQ